jgi:hypothetical protein
VSGGDARSMTLPASCRSRPCRVRRSPIHGGSVSRGSEASRAERLPSVVPGRATGRGRVLRDSASDGPTASPHMGSGRGRRGQFSKLRSSPPPPRPASSSQEGEHAGREVGRSPAIPRAGARARAVTPASADRIAISGCRLENTCASHTSHHHKEKASPERKKKQHQSTSRTKPPLSTRPLAITPALSDERNEVKRAHHRVYPARSVPPPPSLRQQSCTPRDGERRARAGPAPGQHYRKPSRPRSAGPGLSAAPRCRGSFRPGPSCRGHGGSLPCTPEVTLTVGPVHSYRKRSPA